MHSGPGGRIRALLDLHEGPLAGLDDQLPASLRLEEQGRFVIGYYHQTKARFAGKQAESNEGSDDEQEN